MTGEDLAKKILCTCKTPFYIERQRSQHIKQGDGEELQPENIVQYVKRPEKIMF